MGFPDPRARGRILSRLTLACGSPSLSGGGSAGHGDKPSPCRPAASDPGRGGLLIPVVEPGAATSDPHRNVPREVLVKGDIGPPHLQDLEFQAAELEVPVLIGDLTFTAL